MDLKSIVSVVQNGEEKFDALFSEISRFSPHLYKQTDTKLPDMYDHNGFVTDGMPANYMKSNVPDDARSIGDVLLCQIIRGIFCFRKQFFKFQKTLSFESAEQMVGK